MSHPTPIVDRGTLTLYGTGREQQITVGSQAWFSWVDTATGFRFTGDNGSFSARRERAGSRRGGWYWRAYLHRDGARQRAYLGLSKELTVDRLETIAAQLAAGGMLTREPGRHLPSNDPQAPDVRARLGASVSSPPLLTTKLYLPRERPDLVVRPRLFERLDAGLQGMLTLVCAPAGFGKTTLLAEWLRRSGRPTAWLGLDAGDSDPTTFTRYLCAALQMLSPEIGASLPVLLQAPAPPLLEVALTILINDLRLLPPGCVLALDDYHLLSSAKIHDALGFFLEHLPPSLHLVIATREDPPLPLARLRARRQVTELRAEQLRFTGEETTSFLTGVMALPLGAADVATLEARTEGWIAGLQLAALAMQDLDNQPDFVVTFTGSNRFVVDYLVDEVLGRQPAQVQAFLLRTSIFERMCASLCDAVLGFADELEQPPSHESDLEWPECRPDTTTDSPSQRLLEHLERANLFVTALDAERRWYRYHQLFAQVLRQRLARSATREAVAKLHQRASAWFENAGLAQEAVQHALIAQDWPGAARLISRYGLPMAALGQAQTVLGWLSALPESFTRHEASLCVVFAAALILDSQPEASEPLLQDAEACARAMPPEQARPILGKVAALRAACVRISGDLERALVLARHALELLPESEPFWHVAVASNLSRSYLVSGDTGPATMHTVLGTVEPARASGNPFAYLTAIHSLARLQVLQGRLRSAAASFREALEIVPDSTALGHSAAGLIHRFGLGDLHREWNELETAVNLLEQAVALLRTTRSHEAESVLVGYYALARLRQALGDIDGAQQIIADFLELAGRRGFAEVLITRAGAIQARLLLAQGKLAAAVAWAESSMPALRADLRYPREVEHLTLARVWIAQGRADPTGPCLHEALGLLTELLGAAEASKRFSSVIEINILQALALQAQGELGPALVSLEAALRRAEPEGYVRTFVDEGAPMALLLREAQRRGSNPDYVARLLATSSTLAGGTQHSLSEQPLHAAFRANSSALVESLTPREFEVLELVAAGASNGEIAQRLIVSLGTVKKHTANIFGKLEVKSRSQAVARARTLGLLH